MSYSENHLRDWLRQHNCLNISCIEKACNIKQRNLSFFINEQRRISVDEYNSVCKFLLNYGFRALNAE